MTTNISKPKLTIWRCSLFAMALLGFGAFTAYAEESSDSSDLPEASDLLPDDGQPLEDSIQSEEPLEESPLMEEEAEQDRMEAVGDDMDQHLEGEEPEASDVEDVSDDSVDESETVGGDGYVPDAEEGEFEVDL